MGKGFSHWFFIDPVLSVKRNAITESTQIGTSVLSGTVSYFGPRPAFDAIIKQLLVKRQIFLRDSDGYLSAWVPCMQDYASLYRPQSATSADISGQGLSTVNREQSRQSVELKPNHSMSPQKFTELPIVSFDEIPSLEMYMQSIGGDMKL